ncbi:membrane protein [Dyadobacter jejuensis]|uniref:Membrane protein n=1 Tax=Dyadobacter jejuensis TaxID=1082580 RepID=A0A316ALF1_9BACT|nr:YihY/virulence factor BrkB family protein [Dyadobacter jejuensis]PWJ58218.1 membrane protein [Dyadobacter jejuensis]
MLNDFLQSRQFQLFIAWLQKTLFFRETVSWYDIIVNIIDNNKRFDIDQRASAVAFSFTLASFPAVLFLFTLIPYLPLPTAKEQIMSLLQDIVPYGIYRHVAHAITDILNRPRSGVLSFGFIFALLASTNGMISLMKSFDVIFEEKNTRGFLLARAVAMMLTVLLIAVICVTVVLLIVGDAVMSIMAQWNIITDGVVILILNFSRYMVSFGALMTAISLIYRFAPTNGRDFSFINSGVIVASILILVATFGFSFYLSKFHTYNRLYGSIGAIIALMIWFYLLAFLLILGFEINASIAAAKTKNHLSDQGN